MTPRISSDLDSVISELRLSEDLTFTFRVSPVRCTLFGFEVEKVDMLMQLAMLLI